MDKKLTQEEMNGLSPRARKAYESAQPLQEILDVNPNAELIKQEELKQEIKKKIKGKKK
jgi:hypothetical protein|tara:strand:+ start:543 stop:719 length:177 start_codon:yes stop_codon:yes gene_type:complete